MNITQIPLHPSFPEMVSVVIEQPRFEQFRMRFDQEKLVFSRTGKTSLFFRSGLKGDYGWISGLGIPPAFHVDAILLSESVHRPGEVVNGRVCGIFFKGHQDHKILAADTTIHFNGNIIDLANLDPSVTAILFRLYRRTKINKGWFGRKEAIDFLLKHFQSRP